MEVRRSGDNASVLYRSKLELSEVNRLGAMTEATETGSGERKAVLLRLDPAVYDALSRWAADELRSVNSLIELLLRDELRRAGRLPKGLKPPRRPGRPPQEPVVGTTMKP